MKSATRLHQRGAAALIVVLVLFFIVSLVAAYTSRGMIFEQRTSINQMRSTQALDIGDAGIEWAITKLNTGLVNGTCDSSPGGASTFRQRYLTFAAADGAISGVTTANATCARQSSGWVCSCPTAGATIPVGPGSDPVPAFRVYFGLDGTGARANLIRVFVSACTDASANCLGSPQIPDSGKGNISVSAALGLKGALDTIPAAAVTLPRVSPAPESLTLTGGTKLIASNSTANGLAIHAGGTLVPAGDITARGAAGMPEEFAKLEGDASLSTASPGGGLRDSSDCATQPLGCSASRAFTAVFGMPRAVYRQQPGLVRCTSACNSAKLADLAAKNPRSVILVAGDATLDASLGSAANPVALVIEGDVNISGAGTIVTGLVYATTGVWTVGGTPRIDGAIISENPVTMGGGAGNVLEVRYDLATLTKLRTEFGSFVRLPGSWRDFPNPITGGP